MLQVKQRQQKKHSVISKDRIEYIIVLIASSDSLSDEVLQLAS